MKVLGEHYDTNSQQHLDNLEQMKMLSIELEENVEKTMRIEPKE